MSKTIRPNKHGVFPKLKDGFYDIALGNMTQWRFLFHRANGLLIVGIVEKGCYEFCCEVHPSYVSEKLGIKLQDKDNVSDLINDQMFEPGEVERFGRYDESLACKEPL